MKYLIYCTCGHSVERHGAAGCSGADVFAPLPCACSNDQVAALEAAIEEARSRPWEGGPVTEATKA